MKKEIQAECDHAAETIIRAEHLTAFTGAGISVESGIPPFRGENGLWSRYDPIFLDINYFLRYPEESWRLIKEVFYEFFSQAKPNAAHEALAEMERKGWLHSVITQNIDNLHQEAGSRIVYEFHGTSQTLVCMDCSRRSPAASVDLSDLPPKCSDCGGLLKPDFVFFGEGIPEPTHSASLAEARQSDVFLLIGSTGEIMPAGMIPHIAKETGASIIEINPYSSNYTERITDLFLQEKATLAMTGILNALRKMESN